jgi:hypothetical protein
MTIRALSMLVLAVMIAGCGESSSSSASSEAQSTKDRLTGDDKDPGAKNNPLCKLFTAGELEVYVGEPLGAPTNAAGGSGCQWPTKDDTGDVLIQVVGARYHVAPTGAETYKPLPDIGEKGYVVHAFDGWMAGAIVDDKGVIASVAGDKASPATAEALLREVIKRLPK